MDYNISPAAMPMLHQVFEDLMIGVLISALRKYAQILVLEWKLKKLEDENLVLKDENSRNRERGSKVTSLASLSPYHLHMIFCIRLDLTCHCFAKNLI